MSTFRIRKFLILNDELHPGPKMSLGLTDFVELQIETVDL